MKKRVFSAALAMCLCISSHSAVYALQNENDIRAEGSTTGSGDVLSGDAAPEQGDTLSGNAVPGQGDTLSGDAAPGQGDTLSGDAAPGQGDVLTGNSTPEQGTGGDTDLTPTQVYQKMIALKEQAQYAEGASWTNDTPYSSGSEYQWKGGPITGANIRAVGCVAFAFILSDEAFGSMQNRIFAKGSFAYEDIKPGDILRVNNDAHTVIVLETAENGVIVAEGNLSTGDHKGKVHWGRAISKAEVMDSTSHYITRYPENYISPDDPTADQLLAEGTFDGVTGLQWKLTKAGTLTISGSGAIPDYSSADEQPWKDHRSRIRKVVIEDGITTIGSCAFMSSGVLSAVIASSVTEIHSNAFNGSSIISVTIPASVKTIGDSAFHSCRNLSSAVISEGVERIGQNAFQSCSSLTSIAIPASVGEVGAAAFWQCTKMTSAAFAAGSKQVKIGDNLFTQCYSLTSVTLPQSIDRVGEGMFMNCGLLVKIEIPEGAESIAASAFASCAALTDIIIPQSVTKIEAAVFGNCPLKDIYFTGTEEQWNAIQKLGDTPAAIAKATVHYNYSPTSPPSPEPDDSDQNNGSNSGGSNNSGSSSGGSNNSGSSSGGSNNSGSSSSSNDYYGSGMNNGNDYYNGYGYGGNNSNNSENNNKTENKDDSKNEDEAESSANISKASVTLAQSSCTYDGTAQTPPVTIVIDGKTLVLGTDYTVSYSNNTEAGTATITITGIGDYTGSMTSSFTIIKAEDENQLETITCEKTVYKVAYGEKSFKIDASSDEKMTFTSSNPKVASVNKKTGKVTIKKAGIVTITIKAGDVTKKVTVKVNPKKQSVESKRNANGKKMTVTWEKDPMASGYQVQISTDKKFKNNVKSKKLTEPSYTFKKLNADKKYYIRVRSYKKSGGKTLYGDWSK